MSIQKVNDLRKCNKLNDIEGKHVSPFNTDTGKQQTFKTFIIKIINVCLCKEQNILDCHIM